LFVLNIIFLSFTTYKNICLSTTIICIMHASNMNWVANNPGGLDRNNLFFIPDEFDGEMPLIRKYTDTIPDMLVPFRHIPKKNQAVHFFVDDYRFECIWNRPYVYADRYRGRMLLSPDFSVYTNYPIMVQRWNTYRSRWMGAYFQSEGIRVIPSVAWGNADSFEFCFDGIECGGIVAISTRGAYKFREAFTNGFNAMMEQIYPSHIICAGNISKVYLGEIDQNMITSYILERPSYCYRRV